MCGSVWLASSAFPALVKMMQDDASPDEIMDALNTLVIPNLTPKAMEQYRYAANTLARSDYDLSGDGAWILEEQDAPWTVIEADLMEYLKVPMEDRGPQMFDHGSAESTLPAPPDHASSALATNTTAAKGSRSTSGSPSKPKMELYVELDTIADIKKKQAAAKAGKELPGSMPNTRARPKKVKPVIDVDAQVPSNVDELGSGDAEVGDEAQDVRPAKKGKGKSTEPPPSEAAVNAAPDDGGIAILSERLGWLCLHPDDPRLNNKGEAPTNKPKWKQGKKILFGDARCTMCRHAGHTFCIANLWNVKCTVGPPVCDHCRAIKRTCLFYLPPDRVEGKVSDFIPPGTKKGPSTTKRSRRKSKTSETVDQTTKSGQASGSTTQQPDRASSRATTQDVSTAGSRPIRTVGRQS